MKTKLLAASLLVAFATTGFAGPIQANFKSGSCVSEIPKGGFTWSGDPIGFVFFSAHDSEAGCEPTIRNPTSGTHRFVVTPELYKVEALPEWLPTCGRIQFDAQGYTADGLDPFNLVTLVYNTGRDCNLKGEANVNVRTYSTGGSVVVEFQPPESRPSPPLTQPIPVREPGTASLVFSVGALFFALWCFHKVLPKQKE